MVGRSSSRGWPVISTGGQWVYEDTGEPVFGERACKRCGEKPTPEGHDACLGTLPGVVSACCGHGVMKPWQTSKAALGTIKDEK